MTNEKLLSLAKEFQTPLYVFDADVFEARLAMIKKAFGETVRLC